MKYYKLNEITLFLLLAVTSFLLIGCVASESNVHYTGVEDETLKKIDCGKTTKDQLIALLGEPSEQQLKEDGTEMLRYKCTKIKDSKFAMFPPPIAIDDKKEIEHTVVFKLRDGIVQRYKKER